MLVLYPGALLQSRAEPADEMLIKVESRTSYYQRITIYVKYVNYGHGKRLKKYSNFNCRTL